MTFFDIPPGQGPHPAPNPKDEKQSRWKADDWGDEQVATPIEDREQLLGNDTPAATRPRKKSFTGRLHLTSGYSVHRPKRLKSRGRQRAQNAKAGIKLITDFSSGLRKSGQQQQQQQQHQSQQQHYQQKGSPNAPQSKFVDLAALRALEGSPNSASNGSWNWLKRQKSGASPSHLAPLSADVGLSPADRPIVIGISMDGGALDGREISPQTAVLATPTGLPRIQTNATSPDQAKTTPATPSQLRSVWSPDTPASASTLDLEIRRATSSIYSQMTGAGAAPGGKAGVPPVPEVPAGYKPSSGPKPTSVAEEEEVDIGTPCTLFEEDATPTAAKGRQHQRSVARGRPSQSVVSDTNTEWWDVRTPAAVVALRGYLDETPTSTEAPMALPPSQSQANVTNNITNITITNVSYPQPERRQVGIPVPMITEGTSSSHGTSGLAGVPIQITSGTTSPQPTRGFTGISSSAATAGVSSPCQAREHAREPAILETLSEESRDRSHTHRARGQSDVSDAITEFWEDESTVQTPRATTTVPPSRTHIVAAAAGLGAVAGIALGASAAAVSSPHAQGELTQQEAAIQETHLGESERSREPWRSTEDGAASSFDQQAFASENRSPPQSGSLATARAATQGTQMEEQGRSREQWRSFYEDGHISSSNPVASLAAEPRFPPWSGSHTDVQWTSSSSRRTPPTQDEISSRTESPVRSRSPVHSQPLRHTPSPAFSQSQGRNQSPARSGTPRLALGAATMSSADGVSPRRAEAPADQPRAAAGGSGAAGEEPPPYSPPHQNLQAPVRLRPVFPPGHPLHGHFPPSPGPVSPAMGRAMTAQGAVDMTEIPLTPGPQPANPQGPAGGGFVPAEHFASVESRQDRVERSRLEEERKRMEKERKREEGGGAGGMAKWAWRLRNLFSRSAAAPAEAAKKKPLWPWVAAGVIALLILAGVLAGVLLTRKGDPDDPKPGPRGDDDDRFVDVPGFPPMPTGVMTIVGPDNSRSVDSCSVPSTLWSCELPPEMHDSVAPFEPNQPTVVMQVQFDNTSRASWDVPNGDPPVPTPSTDEGSGSKLRRSATLGRRLGKRLAPGISPDPKPPSFEEMFFLGNTTDEIVSDDKAGEPTPFYISILKSASDSFKPDVIQRRAVVPRQFSDQLPDPEVDDDGRGAPARMLPTVRQQPVRLYDRGLPTEHYGFYTYFHRTIYLRTLSANNTAAVDRDSDGGAELVDAKFVVTWSETRFLVKLWTNSADMELLSDGKQPGTMPYPVTMKLDTHGGDAANKFVWARKVVDGVIDAEEAGFLANDIGVGGEVVNPRSDGNRSFGGVDGGVGGCACEWVNFKE